VLTALSDPTRRAVFERVALGPAPVVEISRDLPVSRPAVSQHLKVLKSAGLVVDRAEGNRRIYELDRRGIDALRDYLERFWSVALASFKSVVEQGEGTVG
jgi:DNA-binding transcriptional ArsR family regulator